MQFSVGRSWLKLDTKYLDADILKCVFFTSLTDAGSGSGDAGRNIFLIFSPPPESIAVIFHIIEALLDSSGVLTIVQIFFFCDEVTACI